jgi:hypothetical protein
MTWDAEGKLPAVVELFYDGAWNEVPCDEVDVSQEITIERGRTSLQTSPDPQTLSLKLDNTGGKYSLRNPLSPLYGKIKRNTPIRVTLDGQVRFCGEVHSWPAQWDTEDYVWVDLEAFGPRMRMELGQSPLESPMYQAMMDDSHVAPIAYWPCEDGQHADRFASALDGGNAMTVGMIPGFPTRDVRFHAYSDFLSSDAVPELGVTSLVGYTPVHPFTGEMRVMSLLHLPDDGVTSTEVEALNVRMSGSAGEWVIKINQAGELGIRVRDRDGGIIFDGGWAFAGEDFNGKNILFGLWLQKNVNDIDYQIFTFRENASVGIVTDGTITNRTMGSPRQVTLGAKGDLGGSAMGHVAVFDQDTATVVWDFAGSVLDGWTGEPARERIARLAAEESIPCTTVIEDSTLLGYQGLKATLELMDEAAESDGGILFEDRAACQLKYRPRIDLYNQVPVELDYCDLAPPFIPTEDDDQLWNSVEVSRDGGGSARAVKQTGSLSVEEIGRYEQSYTLSLRSDGLATDQATWRLHLGTVDEARYPVLHVRLTSDSSPELVSAVTGLDIGDRVTVSHLPSFMPPGVADMIVQGYTETTDGLVWDFQFNCTPASPWTVAIAEDTVLGRADTVESALTMDITSTQSTMEVETLRGPLWTTDPVDFPFDVKLGGEEATVTGITGAVTDSFTRSVSNGWGTADTGQSWTTSGGSSSDYSVNGTQGVVALNTTDTSRWVWAPLGTDDVDVTATVATDKLASGAPIQTGLAGRFTDLSNNYLTLFQFLESGSTLFYLFKFVAGTGSIIANTDPGITHVAGQRYAIRLSIKGSALKAKVWVASSPEPRNWTLRGTDTDLVSGDVGVYHLLESGATNAPVTVTWDGFEVLNPQRFTVTRSVNGIVKPHSAGTAVSLANPAVVAL